MTRQQALEGLSYIASAVLVRLEIERRDRGDSAVFPCAGMIDPLREALNDAQPFILENICPDCVVVRTPEGFCPQCQAEETRIVAVADDG